MGIISILVNLPPKKIRQDAEMREFYSILKVIMEAPAELEERKKPNPKMGLAEDTTVDHSFNMGETV